MKIVLFRHATRSAHGLGDSPLSAEGLAQAENLPSFLAPNGPLPKPTHLFCSPKQRARQTLAPLSQKENLELAIDPRLDERHQNESGLDFETRILDLLKDVEALSEAHPEPCVYLCSHLDWLEAVLVLIPSDLSDLEIAGSWSTAEFRIFKIQAGVWTLKSGGGIPSRM